MRAVDYLRSRRQWLVWRLEKQEGRSKPTKPPFSAHTLRGCAASDPTSWTDFPHATAVAKRHGFNGIGFALAPDDDLTGIDLDHCRDAKTGEIDSWAREILAFAETYAEVSPSGTGIHLFARGKVEKATKYDPAGVEIYIGNRYLTYTGRRIEGAPDEIRAAPLTLHALMKRVESFRDKAKKQTAVVAKPPASGENFFRRVNDLAMENLDVWAPIAFPNARYENGTGAWRISSADLDRDLEEDLSIAPEGIVDFGLHDMGDAREGKRTPIDVIMHYPVDLIEGKAEGEVTVTDAALWLCETLGADPVSLGWRDPDDVAALEWPPLASRDELLVSAWLKRKLPPRDYLMGDVICTTSRILLAGETGVGKTLLCLDLAAAIAAGADFLGWQGKRRARVMYLDGELPAETFKERMELIAERYGDGIQLFGYNRDVLGPGEMPPLNTPEGRAWLLREIETVQPDAIFMDAIMCLLAGDMAKEESWEPAKRLVRLLSSKRIAQIWLHHTGHDASKSYGTKTREWEMDTVAMLSKLEEGGDDPSAAFRLEFTKARMKTPGNYRQFATRVVRSTPAGFVAEDAPPAKGQAPTQAAIMRRAFLEAYGELSAAAAFDPASGGVKVGDIRDWMRRRGYLDTDDKGRITAPARKRFGRAKEELLASHVLVENDGLIST